ncbi:MAG: hypothetical protein PUP91_06855 [Rhizonema sp. PD37]|nr:hypothetical protein [Rhizonema sp. PD37]
MFNKQTICITLAVVLCCSTVKPTIAQPVPVLALPLVSNPVGLVFVSTVVVGTVIWYVYLDRHHRKFRSRIAPNTMHSESHEQYEEKFSINDNGLRCEEMADEETQRTGKKWRVKRNAPLRGTGLLYTKKKLQWECIITDAPEESKQ